MTYNVFGGTLNLTQPTSAQHVHYCCILVSKKINTWTRTTSLTLWERNLSVTGASEWRDRQSACLGSWYATRLGISNQWSSGDLWLCVVCEIVNHFGRHLQYTIVHLDLANCTVAGYVVRNVRHLICNWNVAVASVYLACHFWEYSIPVLAKISCGV